MDLCQFDFELPDQSIALRPASPRDSARLLIIHKDGRCDHAHMRDLPQWLNSGDMLVANDSKVIPAALEATRSPRRLDTQPARIQLNLLERLAPDTWSALVRPAKRLKPGDPLIFGTDLHAQTQSCEAGMALLQFNHSAKALDAAIEKYGTTPLPPYIARRRRADKRDTQDYQTLYATRDGSVAAPTAGLHFTPKLQEDLAQSGIDMRYITLHVGAGTFAPIRSQSIENHAMHSEWGHIPDSTAQAIAEIRANGHGRIIPVGTTALRVLETAARAKCVQGFCARTDLFLRPGDHFAMTDALITNFHQPRSTLFVLVCALMGTDIMQAAYRTAMQAGYRFCSYGDACLLLPHD